MAGGRPSKYGKQLVNAIVEKLVETGDRKVAWTHAGISESVFYDYKSRYPEFSEAIQAAEKEWRHRQTETLQNLAVQGFLKHLSGSNEEVWTTREVTILPDGSEIVKVTQRLIRRGPAAWAILRVLDGMLTSEIPSPSGMSSLQAVQMLLADGLALPEQAAIVQDAIATMQEQLRHLPEKLRSTGQPS